MVGAPPDFDYAEVTSSRFLTPTMLSRSEGCSPATSEGRGRKPEGGSCCHALGRKHFIARAEKWLERFGVRGKRTERQEWVNVPCRA